MSPVGPGKYDAIATIAREAAQAKGVLLIVIGGYRGSGFSVQAPIDVIAGVPKLLREVADQIEASS